MKELTLKDKESLVILLERHYAIKEKNFINAIASNDEERLDLTLKAYTIGAERINTPTNVPTNTNVSAKTLVVVINNLYSKTQFIEAVKEAKNLSTKEAMNYANQMFIEKKGKSEQFYSKPFMVGDFKDSIFTSDQWAKICAFLEDNMEWQYV